MTTATRRTPTVLLFVLVSLAWGSSFLFIKVAATQIGLAALVGLAIAPFIGGLAPITVSWPAIWSLLTLGLLSTGIVYVWNATIIKEWGATAGSTVTYVTPIIGVILGILVLGETLHWNEPAGGAFVILGVLLGRLPTRKRRKISDTE